MDALKIQMGNWAESDDLMKGERRIQLTRLLSENVSFGRFSASEAMKMQ
jgi:hypothetical protein